MLVVLEWYFGAKYDERISSSTLEPIGRFKICLTVIISLSAYVKELEYVPGP